LNELSERAWETNASGERRTGGISTDPEAFTVEASKPVELLPVQDFVSCLPPSDTSSEIFELQIVQRNSTFGKVVHLEFDCKTVAMRERWVEAVVEGMNAAFREAGLQNQAALAYQSPSPIVPQGPRGRCLLVKQVLLEWADWFKFPVKSLLKCTIPDVHKANMRHWYPIAFVMSMVWLAFFAFLVIEVCEIIHEDFGISTEVLGFTVAAVGTSFPNVISCIAVSKQGRTAMAIANSLGANIQNVFLALALPWTIQCLMNGSFQPPVEDLFYPVMWMFFTLGLMVIIVVSASCKMPAWSGIVFLVTYVVYLIVQLGAEVVGCASWPFEAC